MVKRLLQRSTWGNRRAVAGPWSSDKEIWTNPRDTHKVEVQDFRTIDGELLRITLRFQSEKEGQCPLAEIENSSWGSLRSVKFEESTRHPDEYYSRIYNC